MINNKSISAFLLFLVFFINAVSAQVPVREEPHHKVVLENEYVRLIDVHIAPHDTTLTHIHAAPSVIVFLTKSTLGAQIVGDTPAISNVNPGGVNYAPYDAKPVTHRVWNQGASLFHVMDIEMVKKSPADDTCSVISQSDFKLQWQKRLVRVYSLNIAKEKKYSLPKSNCAYLLIDISGIIATSSPGSVRSLQAGGFVFFPPQSNIEINGNNKENAQCVLLEMK